MLKAKRVKGKYINKICANKLSRLLKYPVYFSAKLNLKNPIMQDSKHNTYQATSVLLPGSRTSSLTQFIFFIKKYAISGSKHILFREMLPICAPTMLLKNSATKIQSDKKSTR